MAQSETSDGTPLMNAPPSAFLGYLKYTGAAVEEGLMDPRKAAQALIGFDEAVRQFVVHQQPQLAAEDFDFPVLVRPGSWEALIPQTVAEWIAAGFGLVATTYLATAAKKVAERDFEDVRIKDVFSKALEAIQWLIRIGKHLRQLTTRQTDHLRWRRNNEEVGIPNAAGEYLYVPKVFFEFYLAVNPRLLAKIASLVGPDRKLVVGVYADRRLQEEAITAAEKTIFTGNEDEDEVLFPELTHGLPVALEGFVTRGNATANTLGFKYREHILTCHPADGSIVSYKAFLFGPARMIGTVTRTDESGGIQAKRPRIIFTRMEPLDRPTTSLPLFPDPRDEEQT